MTEHYLDPCCHKRSDLLLYYIWEYIYIYIYIGTFIIKRPLKFFFDKILLDNMTHSFNFIQKMFIIGGE